jgi:hypothetical protein
MLLACYEENGLLGISFADISEFIIFLSIGQRFKLSKCQLSDPVLTSDANSSTELDYGIQVARPDPFRVCFPKLAFYCELILLQL